MSARGRNSPLFCENQNILRICGAAELVEVSWSSSARSVKDRLHPQDPKQVHPVKIVQQIKYIEFKLLPGTY